MSLGDQDLMAIMATFKSFDVDGDGSLSKEELSNLLYRISKQQSLEEIDKEVNDIMEACDKDKSGQISYAEFFATQKKHDFSPKAEAALQKLVQFMALEDGDKKQVIRENDQHFTQLVQEREQAILREQREKAAEGADKRQRKDHVVKHGSEPTDSPKITSPYDKSNNEAAESPKSLNGQDGTANIDTDISAKKDEEIQALKTALSTANERVVYFEQEFAKLESKSNKVQQELTTQLAESVARSEQVDTNAAGLAQQLQLAQTDLETSGKINETLQKEVKELRSQKEDKSVSVDGKVRELELELDELRATLDLARRQDPEKDNDELILKLRFENTDLREKEEKTEAELQILKADLTAAHEKYERTTTTFTERIHADKVARSELEVSNRNILDAKNQELAGSKTEVAGLKTELETLRNQYSRLEKQHALQSDTHANDEQLKTLQADHSTLKGDLANVQSEYNNLKRNLAIIQSENNALKGKNDVIDQENQSLTNLLESDRQKAKDGERKAADSLRKLEQERDTARRGEHEATKHSRSLEAAMNQKAEEVTRKEDELAELRQEMKRVQIQNLEMATELQSRPVGHAEVDEESPVRIEQKILREKIRRQKSNLRKFHVFYFLWVVLVLWIVIAWAPGVPTEVNTIHPL